MKSILRGAISAVFLAGMLTSCNSETKKNSETGFQHPEWSKNASIYEVNIRQYSEEGTFDAFAEDLPRLQEMGVDILWLMPIHPIGEINRKGLLGSYYSVMDYKAVNPNYGTNEDFQALVQKAHDLDMKVILDWVANHTAWGHPWTENPEWYTLNESGDFTPPRGTDWTDVIQLNYESDEMRAAMIEALEFWVREFDVDGYRADVAGMIPTDFWNETRDSLDAIKPVFMLAEAEQPDHHEKAFDMSYAWEYSHIIREIAKGNKELSALDTLFAKEETRFPESAYRMYFTTNHDENSWSGTDPEMYGENFENFAVLSATIDGMPLIYNGQETGLDKQLEFFEKDPIEWDGYEYQDLYRSLLTLKEENEALWNGQYGGDLEIFDLPDDLYGYKRTKGENEVYVFLNFGDEEQTVPFSSEYGDENASFTVLSKIEGAFENGEIMLQPHSWNILIKQ